MEKAYTEKELKKHLKDAYSVENREGHELDHLAMDKIGTIKKGNVLWDIYQDEENHYWYGKRYIEGERIISEYEHIFGHMGTSYKYAGANRTKRIKEEDDTAEKYREEMDIAGDGAETAGWEDWDDEQIEMYYRLAAAEKERE